MADVSNVSPELARSVTALARAVVAAARSWALYPPEHPAVGSSLERLRTALHQVTGGAGCAIGVTPGTLLIEGVPLPARDGPVVEAAAFLHDCDILQITFAPEVPPAALRSLMGVLTMDAGARRVQGGPERIWAESGHPSIAIEQIDYRKVLEDREVQQPVARRDDLWKAIVRSILDRRKTFDEAAQRRLLEIAGDPDAIGELVADVMAPSRTPGGAPMITTQAATVLAAYRHLTGIVSVLAPDRVAEVTRNIATATAGLDPRVVMQLMLGGGEGGGAGAGGGGGDAAIVRSIGDAFDDLKVAQLLATTLAIEGQASERLATVVDTIAPDEERKRRVLTLTRSLLSESDFGKLDRFQTIWRSMEQLLLTYDEKPFVSEQYRTALDGASARAGAMAAGELPPELDEWLVTLGQENVRRLSVTLIIDLLRLERDPVRAADLAGDMAVLVEDLLLSGEYASAVEVARALREAAADQTAIGRDACRRVLEELGGAPALREALGLLDEMDETEYAPFRALVETIGPASVEALQGALLVEADTPMRRRAAEIIVAFGAASVGRLTPLVGHAQWFVQRNAVEVLGRIGSPEAVPLLQPLLRSKDPRVMREVVRALSNIDDPAAARAVHTVLRAAAGEARRSVIDALVAQRDRRVVPVLVRILGESRPLGRDHAIVLETLGALGQVGDDRAVDPVAAVMRQRRWFARKKVRALKARAVGALVKIGTPRAAAALDEAARTGDRLLRKIAAVARSA